MIELSVVIPTYNTGPMTLRCCEAVLVSWPNAEVIVADDGSTDGTAELLPPAVQVVRLDGNRGFAVAANAGVAAARGRIVLLLNSDAIVEASSLRAFVSAFDADPKLGVAGAQLLNEDGTRQWSGGRTPTLLWMLAVVSGAGAIRRSAAAPGGAGARRIDWVSGAAMAFRAEVWRVAGPLSERFLFYCQDIEFCLRAREGGWGVRIVDKAHVTHGHGRTIAADNPLRYDPERLWPDLLTWGTARYGKAWLLVARPALITAAALRIAWRTLLRRDTAAMTRALRRLAA